MEVEKVEREEEEEVVVEEKEEGDQQKGEGWVERNVLAHQMGRDEYKEGEVRCILTNLFLFAT